MGTIKFRAWDYYEKKMYEVGGIDFFWGIIKLQWWHRAEDGMDRRKTKEMDMDIDKELHDLFGVELMQYTGLKDKNGKEIYEGDIVRIKGHALQRDKRGIGIDIDGNYVVKWSEKMELILAPSPESKEGWLLSKNLHYIEVIGNIFEHKHLLEGTA